MKYCSGFPFCAESELLKERMQDECPIVCKAEKCRDKWIDSVKTADTTGTTETDYGTEIFEMHFETQGEHINFHHNKIK